MSDMTEQYYVLHILYLCCVCECRKSCFLFVHRYRLIFRLNVAKEIVCVGGKGHCCTVGL